MMWVWVQIAHQVQHDPLTQITLGGIAFYAALGVGMCRYAATHYTRVPGTGWTTWEKTLEVRGGQTEAVQKQEEAA